MKNKRCCSSTLDRDRLSYLPDLIRTHIISFLSMEDAIRTTILSKQWRNICTSLSNLSFHQNYFEEMTKNKRDFKDFVYQTLILHDGSDIESFGLWVKEGNMMMGNHVNAWCSFAVRHNVKDFELEVFGEMLERLPYCLVGCRSLNVLTLAGVNVSFSIILGFPLLRKLSLYSVYLVDDDVRSSSGSNRKLDISCSLLEDLSLAFCSWDQFIVLTISAYNLKTLVIYDEFVLRTINITSPKLLDITYYGKPPEISSDTNPSLVNATFEFHSHGCKYHETLSDVQRARASKILMGMQNVERLILRHRFIEFLPAIQDLSSCTITSCFSMKHLRVDMCPTTSDVQVITFLLGIYPNLQTLAIYVEHEDVINLEEDTQAQSLSRGSILKHLKIVGIRDFGGSECEMNLLKYLLEWNTNFCDCCSFWVICKV
ncbi:hypothetical protein ACHQM5_004516 [Ranunculus cassubicifolius]